MIAATRPRTSEVPRSVTLHAAASRTAPGRSRPARRPRRSGSTDLLNASPLASHLGELWSLVDAAVIDLVGAGGDRDLAAEADRSRARVAELLRLADRGRCRLPWTGQIDLLAAAGSSVVSALTGPGGADVPARSRSPHAAPVLRSLPGLAIGQLAEQRRGLAAGVSALLVARAAVVRGGDARLAATAQQLALTARLHVATDPTGDRPPVAVLTAAVEVLLTAADQVPEHLRWSLWQHRAALAVLDLAPALAPRVLQRMNPSLPPSAVVAARTRGRWAASPAPRQPADRLVLLYDPLLVGPLRGPLPIAGRSVCHLG